MKKTFEEQERGILEEAKAAKKNMLQAVKDGLIYLEEGYEWLNNMLVKLHRKWFLLHRVNMGDE